METEEVEEEEEEQIVKLASHSPNPRNLSQKIDSFTLITISNLRLQTKTTRTPCSQHKQVNNIQSTSKQEVYYRCYCTVSICVMCNRIF